MKTDIVVIDEDYLDAAFEMVTRNFVVGSTLHRALNISLDEYRDYLRLPFNSMIDEGLSLAAIDHTSGDILGCLIATDFYLQISETSAATGKFTPLAALTGTLCEQYQRHRKISPGEVVLIDMGVVSQAATGKGVYQMLRNYANDHARIKGFDWVVGELSSSSTQHVVINKLQHNKVAEVVFHEFVFDGTKPFQSINEPPSIILSEGSLRP